MVSVRFLLSKFTLNVGVAKLRQLRVMARVVIVRLPESRHESAFPTAASISQLRSLSVVNVWLVCKSALAKAETSLLNGGVTFCYFVFGRRLCQIYNPYFPVFG